MGYYIGTTEESFLNSLPGNDALVLNLDAGLRGSYNGSGSTWTDIAGSQQNGTLVNSPSFLTNDGAKGGSLAFNGTNQYVTVPDVTGVTDFGATDFTIDIWIKANTSGITTNTIVYKGFNSYRIWYYNSITYIGDDSGSGAGTTLITANTWCNVTFVVDSTASSRTLIRYKNGSFVSSGGLGGTYSANASNLQIGRLDNSQYFDGSIAVFKIYDRVLTASEITENYNAYKGRFGL